MYAELLEGLKKCCSEQGIDHEDLLAHFQSRKDIYPVGEMEPTKQWTLVLRQHLSYTYTNPYYSPYPNGKMEVVKRFLDTHFESDFSSAGPDTENYGTEDDFSLTELLRQFDASTAEMEPYSLWVEFRMIAWRSLLWAAWRPLLMLRRKKDRRFLSVLLQNRASDGVWSTIERGSAVQNYFLFRIPYWRELRGDSLIVDLAFLVLQTADEYIDGVINAHRDLSPTNALSEKVTSACKELEFRLEGVADRLHVILHGFKELGEDVLHIYNKKYACTYAELLDRIEMMLDKLNQAIRSTKNGRFKAEKVIDFLSFYVETALDDILLMERFPDGMIPVPVVNWHFNKKTSLGMSAWIGLRSDILSLPVYRTADRFSFGSLLYICQMFDDLKDIKVDHGYQANLFISLANRFHPEEYRWFTEHVNGLPEELSIREQVGVALNMPFSLLHMYTFTRNKGLKELDWLTQKGANGGWYRNWTGRGPTCVIPGIENGFQLKDELRSSSMFFDSEHYNLVFNVIVDLHLLFEGRIPLDHSWAFVFDLLYHDDHFARLLMERISIGERYLLKMNGFFMSPGFKLSLLRKALKTERKQSTDVLNGIFFNEGLPTSVRTALAYLFSVNNLT
ncbi:MAG: hypothetical protein HKN79_07780 [Flavobacteriales bacterium]|nr:hypothetical protein [Flavobacteriales bacterium]